MRRENAAALLGLVFFLRGEFLQNSYFYTLPSVLFGPALWSLLLLLPLVLALRGGPRPAELNPWLWILVFIPPLTIWARPWPQHQAWTQAPGEVLHGAAVWALGGAGFFLIILISLPRISAKVSWSAGAVALLFLIQQTWAAALHAWNQSRSDMLYVVDLGAKTLLHGKNPYVMRYGDLPFTYYPGYLMGYLPGAALGWDPRILAILYGAAALALLGRLGKNFSPGSALGASGIFLGNYLFTRDDLSTPWTWLLAGLTLALQESSPWVAGASWGFCLASREWFWLLTPFWLAWLFQARSRAKAWAAIAAAGLTALVVGSPAILGSTGSTTVLETTTYRFPGGGTVFTAGQILGMQRHGLAWIFFYLGAGRWMLPACFLAWAVVLALYLRKTRTLADMAAWGALSVAVFQILCVPMEPYHFLFPAYLLLASAVLEEKAEVRLL